MALSDTFLQELHYKNDIEGIVSQYVTLKKRGNTSVGLCPFHNEKTPSFTVYNDTQSFYCFGCGSGGDIITFIKKIENLDYIDAVKLLAERSGMTMPEDGYDDSLLKLRRRILEANRAAARFFYEYLLSPQGKTGLDYFLGRGLSMNTIRRFGLGYAPDSWTSLYDHLRHLGFSDSELISANLVRQGKNNSCYDNFRNRVMTPIINLRGNVIAFGGRVLDDSKPKYINTSDTLVYKKTHELFALNLAKEAKSTSLILCEGYMDVIAMHQAGFKSAVACCGTSLTTEQVKIISRYCNEVVLAYDADDAGRKAVNKAITLFNTTDLTVRVPELKGGKDPDEIIRKCGYDRFKGMLEEAENDTEYLLLQVKNKYDVNTTDGKIAYLNEALKILSRLTPIERDIFTSKLSKDLDVSKESIKTQLTMVMNSKNRAEESKKFKTIVKQNNPLEDKFNTTLRSNRRLAKAQERLVSLLLFNPDFYKYVKEIETQMLDAAFFKKAFGVIKCRLAEEKSVDLTSLSGEFTDEELGYLSFIQLGGTNLQNPKQEFTDCIKTIQREYNKENHKDAAALSDDDYRNLFKQQ